MLARHQTLPTLIQDGITLVNEARPDPPVQRVPVRVEVTGEVGPDRSFELALVTVRRDQVDEILPALTGLPARLVVMMQNNSLDLAHVSDIVGHDRTLFGFPGVGGYRRDDVAGAVFRSAGFAVSTTADIDGWLKTHAVFIAATCASINSCGGDAVKLAADRERRIRE